MPVKQDWAPYTDWTEMEFWPAGRAPRNNFGAEPTGLLAERYRVYCRTMYRGLEMRWPRCGCQAGLRITVPTAARYKPELAQLTLLHALGCPRRRDGE